MDLRKRVLLFIALVLVIFVLLTYQSIEGSLNTPKFGLVLYPLRILEQGITSVTNSIEDIFARYILVVGKEEENRKLFERIRNIERERVRYAEALYENERLRALLDFKTLRTDSITAAEVFARDPTNWFQVLRINKGANDGISKDMIAVTPLGVVGRIHNVFRGTSDVILITDVNSSVAVRMQSSRTEGILEGSGDNRCYVKYVSRDIDVRKGDKVITSGLDGLYPAGLQVGYVTNVMKREGDFFQVIEVIPAQDFKAIEEVAILKKK